MSDVMRRIRKAAATAAAGPLADARVRPSFPIVAAQSPFPPGATREELLARFMAELEMVAGKAYGPLKPAAAATKVVELLYQAAGIEPPRATKHATEQVASGAGPDEPRAASPRLRVLSWDAAEIRLPGLAPRLGKAEIELVPGDVPNDENHQRVLEEHASLLVGLSGAVAALADTGSIVVTSGQGRARIASLLPPVHVAVLPVSRLYPTMQDWLSSGGADLARKTANLVVITGSSRTSDIELQLTLGMHGPKALHVVLLDD